MALDPFDKFLSHVKNEEWKNMRSIVSKTFTSGKLKLVNIDFRILIYCKIRFQHSFNINYRCLKL